MFRIFGILVFGLLCLGGYDHFANQRGLVRDWWRNISPKPNHLAIGWQGQGESTNSLDLDLSTGNWVYFQASSTIPDDPNSFLSLGQTGTTGKLNTDQLATVKQWIDGLPPSQCYIAVNSLIVVNEFYYRYDNQTAVKILRPISNIIFGNSTIAVNLPK